MTLTFSERWRGSLNASDGDEFSFFRKRKEQRAEVTQKLSVGDTNNSAFFNIAREKFHILVAIPAYNEEPTVAGVVLRSLQHADDVIVVDDGSTDNTPEMAQLAGATVIRHEKNMGYGVALASCFEAARHFGAEMLVILDADGQHDPGDIPVLLQEMYVSDADIVIGSRFTNGHAGIKNIPPYRVFGMKILNKATNFTSQVPISDTQSGFRAYSRKAINGVNLQHCGMGAGSEILIAAADRGLKISEVYTKVRYDIEKVRNRNPVGHGLNVINAIIRLIAQKRPLFFFGLPGVVSLSSGLLLFLIVLNHYNASNTFLVNYALISGICSLIGILGISTSLVLWAIHDVKQSTA